MKHKITLLIYIFLFLFFAENKSEKPKNKEIDIIIVTYKVVWNKILYLFDLKNTLPSKRKNQNS